MQPILSILWIGPEAGLGRAGLSEAEAFDVTWLADTDAISEIPCASFDACAIAFDEVERASRTIAALARRRDMPPFMVVCRGVDADAMRARLPLDAGDVFVRDSPRVVANFAAHLYEQIDRLVDARRRAAHASTLGSDTMSARHGLIGTSEALRAAFDLASRAAGGIATILLHGETGTGKEVFARAIHQLSDRNGHRFVAVNCAAIPDTLLESELFGHVRGAFTGANTSKAGLFEVARAGTLFLDEVGETSPSLQAKLLRAIQEREIRPVGGSHDRKVDVRIVAASNRDLRVEAARGNFREDLFYRLAVFPITIPALRKRGGDVIPLAQHFLRKFGSTDPARPRAELSMAAAELLITYPWPGNVRELENEMQRALTLAADETLITPAFLSESVRSVAAPIDSDEQVGKSLREIVEQVEAQVIRRTIANNGGRKARSARELGITREGLYKKMKRLGIG